ncbi:hypothetical protein AXG93_1712s1330 [Marchantia polymorpha subsp. ruderalis]|uniref:Uncharacterized protein n=1 Tax=Marchantia polymorpha subsp. ruderalis TaxID=1480154 RepID=A0A176VYT0_MARPO|nr:hypothetical protein AXG93_1712s1330 [Marchantia polymorpha subsp. ruderalis]
MPMGYGWVLSDSIFPWVGMGGHKFEVKCWPLKPSKAENHCTIIIVGVAPYIPAFPEFEDRSSTTSSNKLSGEKPNDVKTHVVRS